jgi:hypothetical protein
MLTDNHVNNGLLESAMPVAEATLGEVTSGMQHASAATTIRVAIAG